MPTVSLAQPTIKISNQAASRAFMDDLIEVLVDTTLHLPGMFTISLQDPALKWVDDALLAIGKEVEIQFTGAGDGQGAAHTVIKGEITALQPDFDAQGETTLLVRGYDKSHRLHRGRQTRTFVRQTDAHIASTVASEAGLVAQVDNTSVQHEYVLQNNQTNMEFLHSRAERIGFQVYVAGGKLYFKKGDSSRGSGPVLAFGGELISFRPCWTAAHQADKVTVKGWDAKAKQAITSTINPNGALKQGGMTKTGGDEAKAAFGSAEASITDRPVFTAGEAQALATALSNDIGREFVDAEGRCVGDPGVQAGYEVTIRGVGKRFSGKYFVTSATHVYNEEGYWTNFSVTGRQPQTISHLLAGGYGDEQAQGLVRGVVTGLVTNLNDPENLGRVKVKYAWLGEIESDWLRVATPMAGPSRGLLFLPEVNDEVLIAFEQGDVHHPYIIGALWNSKDKPPKGNSDVVKNGKVEQRILQTRAGHQIVLDDSAGAEKITIVDKTGKNKIEIDSNTNAITINVDKDLSSDAKGATTIQSTGKITLKSSDDLSIECRNLEIKAQVNANVQANSGVTIKNAAAQIAMTGPTVNINNGALEVM